MKLAIAFETVPDADDPPTHIEYWDKEKLTERLHFEPKQEEAFVHKPTASAASVYKSGEFWNVQTTQGDFADGQCVVHPDDPSEFVSGLSGVVMTELESLGEARAIAFAWIRGLSSHNAFGDGKEYVDGTEVDGYGPIE